MATRTINGAIWQKQGEDLVKLMPETLASNVHCEYREDKLSVQGALDTISGELQTLETLSTDALVFRGVVNSVDDLPRPADGYKVGDTYKVNTAGTYKGIVTEPGDALIVVDTKGADSDWVVLQANIDGAVTGPVNAVDGQIALFDGTTGKVIKAGESLAGIRTELDDHETRITTLEGRADAIEAKDAEQDGRLSDAEGRLDAVEAKNTEQDGRLDDVEDKNDEQDGRLDAVEAKNTAQDGRLDALEGRMDTAEDDIDALEGRATDLEGRMTTAEGDIDALEGRMDAVEAKNDEQDGRLDALEADLDATKWIAYSATEAGVATAAAPLQNFGVVICGEMGSFTA